MQCGNSWSGVSESSFGQQKTVTEASVMTEQNGSRAVVGMKEVVFYYDVVCPFAFIARKLIEGVARRTGAKIRWKPVLLGKVCNTDRMNVDEANLICLFDWRNSRYK